MGFFGFGKEKTSGSSAGTSASPAAPEQEAAIKVLGSGCDKCQALEKAAIAALTELGQEPRVQHITDFAEIAKYGVMQTPALVAEGKVISYGKVLSKDEVIKLLQKTKES